MTVERDGKQTTEMRREQRTRWEPAFGHVEDRFDDVVIPGSQRLAYLLLEARCYGLLALLFRLKNAGK